MILSEYVFRNTRVTLSRTENGYTLVLRYKDEIIKSYAHCNINTANNSFEFICKQLPLEQSRLGKFVAQLKVNASIKTLTDTSCQIDNVEITVMNEYLYIEVDGRCRAFHVSIAPDAVKYVEECLPAKAIPIGINTRWR